MRPHPTNRLASMAVVVVVMGACGPAADVTDGFTALERRGQVLFTEETFEGNGRVCSTCHEPEQFGTITPEFVQAQFELDPEGPLFRAIDSDDGTGGSYERLLEHATIRIPFFTPYDEVLGRAIRRCARPEATAAVVFRGSPTVFNVALEEALMHDARERGDLELQARNAIDTHAEAGRPSAQVIARGGVDLQSRGRQPEPEELTAIARFQEALFSSSAIKAHLDTGAELRLPDGVTPEEVRGRTFFEPDRLCGVCHAGPMLNRTSEFHPDTQGSRTESTSVGAEPDNPNPKYEWCFVDPETNEISPPPGIPLDDAPEYLRNGRLFRRPVADPGVALVRDPTMDFPFTFPDGTQVIGTPALLSAVIGLPFFKIPTLWGTPDTAPYFHDNSAKTLEDVLDHYNFMFREDFPAFATERLGCDLSEGPCMSESDKADIIAYMQLLSFDGRGIRPAASP